MFKRVIKLFQIARKFSTSGAVEIINEMQQLPAIVNLFFNLISIGANSGIQDKQKTSGEKLCVANSLEALKSYDFIDDARATGDLSVYACHFDMKKGALSFYDEASGQFTA